MRPVERGDRPENPDGTRREFRQYRDARDPLLERIGEYCSYCEVVLSTGADLEHVQPKTVVPALERDWDNFLLACGSCNSIKGDQAIAIDDYLWPDRDNTAKAFVYDYDLPPRPNPELATALQTLASRTISLTGLDRRIGHAQYSRRDQRHQRRREAWGIALLSLRDLRMEDTESLRRSIVLLALSRGFWSVWMAVFDDDIDMRRRFIEAFRGTAIACFDEEARPVARPGGRV